MYKHCLHVQTVQCNAMSITEAGRRPLFLAHSKKNKIHETQTLNEIILNFRSQVAEL